MNVFILEGASDVIFFKYLLDFHFDKSNIPTAYDTSFKKGINTLRNMLKGRSYHYIKTKFGTVIYGDNGKSVIISKILPRLVIDTLGKVPDVLKFLTVLDEDSTPMNIILNKINSELDNRNIPYSKITRASNNEIIVHSTSKPEEYRIIIRLFLIPKSLEKQLVIRGMNYCIPPSSKKVDELLNNDPHESLKELAKIKGIQKDDLIRNSILEQWFIDDEWYSSLISEISLFFEL